MALPHRRLTVTREGTRAAEAAGQARRVLGCKLDLFAALIGVGDLAAAEALGAELQEIIDESRRDAFSLTWRNRKIYRYRCRLAGRWSASCSTTITSS